MKRLHLLSFLLLFLCCCTGVMAQNSAGAYRVHGTVVDSLTLEAEPYATIRIYPENNLDEAAAMLITDAVGVFDTTVKKTGKYLLLVTSVGRRPIEKLFEVKASETDLGTLLIAEDINTLGEVAVVAKKPLVKVDMDKIAYDVEEDPESESKTVLDMLRKVPMVSVDGEGNISLVGKSSFKFYLNGKPNNMLTNNAKDVLRNMPASSVKNIEVITNPGVKYDAEGVGGIINIVTTGGGAIDGYSLNLSGAYMTNNSYNGSVYGATKWKKLSFSGNYGYTQYNNNPIKTNNTFEYFNSPGISMVKTVYDDVIYKSGMHNFSLESSYELDSLNLFSLSGSFFRVAPENTYIGYNSTYGDGNEIIDNYNVNVLGNSLWGSGNLAFDYQHLSPHKAGDMFVFSYRMDRTPIKTDQITRVDNTMAGPSYQQHILNKGKSLENTFQADYTLHLGAMHIMNFGAKYIYRINDSKNFEKRRFSDSEPWTDVNQVGSGDNNHRQHVLGMYTEYNLRYKSFGLKGGLRYEFTSQNVKYDNYNEPPVDFSFSDFVPSLLLSYSLKGAQNLSLGYNMRINRPGISLLNPFRDSSQTPIVVIYGNPKLDTERYHSLSFGYGTFSPNFSLNLNLDYSFSNNSITSVSFVDEQGRVNYTKANIGRNHTPMLNLYTNWNPSGSTRLTLSGMYGYTFLSTVGNFEGYGVKERKNRGDNYNIYLGVQQNLPWKLNLSCYGGYGSSGVDLYTVESMRFYYYGVQLQRAFLKDDKLSFSLNLNNFAPKFVEYKSVTMTDDYRQTMINRSEQMNFSISVSYKIGNFRSSVKKAAKTIHNTDVVGGAGSGSGTGTQGGGAMKNK